MMMDQESHFVGNIVQVKSFTRSAARHLRRKRLNEARRAEKEQFALTNDANINANQEPITEKEAESTDVITKSKARRLRKENKVKQQLQGCCSFCDSYVCSPALDTTANQPPINDKNAEETITKSKARRLRKKNKIKLLQSGCPFCCNVYTPGANEDLYNYMKTTEYDPNCCYKDETEIISNHNQSHKQEIILEERSEYDKYVYTPIVDPNSYNYMRTTEYNGNRCYKDETDIADNQKNSYEPEKEFEAESNDIKHDKEEDQLKSEDVNGGPLEALYSPGSSSPLVLENEQQEHCKKYYEKTGELVDAVAKHKIVDAIINRIYCPNEDISDLTAALFNVDLDALPAQLQKLKSPSTFTDFEQNIKVCNEEREDEVDSLKSPILNSNKNGLRLDEVEFNEDSESRIGTLTLSSSSQELAENVTNSNLSDTSKNSSIILPAEEIEISCNNNEAQNVVIKTPVKLENTDSQENIEQNTHIGSITNSVDTLCIESSIKKSNTTISSTHEEPQSPVTRKKMTNTKITIPEKSRDEVKAEREAKKAAKAAAKAKAKGPKGQEKDTSEKATSKPGDAKSTNSNETVEAADKENARVVSAPAVLNKSSNVCTKEVSQENKNEGKSKSELRAERRAQQEARRAAKQQLLSQKSKPSNKETDNAPAVPATVEPTKKSPVPKKVLIKENCHEVNLFKHLYHERELALVNVPSVNSNIHPAIVRLGVQYGNKVIVGSNARCVALLAAVKQLIRDFERPSQADFIRGLETSLQESAAYLHHCRPLAVSMQNALRHLKWQMTQLSSTLSDTDAKTKLGNSIDTYILEQIELADKAISLTIQKKISDGNVILTYGYSSLIHKILLDAHTMGKKFRVIVADGRPRLEGKEQLRRLAKAGIECSYILINALSYVMPEVSKVFLGAHAILANGAVMSRVGTAQVALMARAFNVPVLVACETHKSCERVQTDSIVYNELGNADELADNEGSNGKKSSLSNWKTKKFLNLLNITYDVTPADLVTAVVTELAILPCTSVPVILRIKPSEI